MSITVRPFAEADTDAFLTIRSAVYGNGVPASPEQREVNGAGLFVGEIGGAVVGMARQNDYTITRGLANLKTGGVAGVGVDPTSRKSGVASELMRHLLREMSVGGVPMASLYAYREPFYRKFGYEVCGKRIHITCPVLRLPKLDSDLVVRRLEPTDWPLIRPCYETFAHARSGLHMRGDQRWTEVVNARDFPKIYAFGNPVEAYALLVHKVDFWEAQKVAEVAWATEAGYQALIGWFASIGANKTCIDWSEPSDSPFVARYLDQGVELKIDRPVCYRVTNVPDALSQLIPESSGEFTFQVSDPVIPANQGPWKVKFDPRGVEVDRAASAQLSFDIQTFTQAFMGEPSLTDLVRNGLVNSSSASNLFAAAALLTPLPVACWDFF